ncbi:lysophospholipid acyltransferase family protein [Mesorhizobium sp. BAC0120]|uniref:lysophospholipid acyltransferase family protein n=1 Tax=Mesorhizobium sp. BAC0120 TaxID=3090670 RepID=UPI003999F217
MIAKIRAGFALAVIAVTALFLGLTQYLVLRTGITNPASIPRCWHKIVLWALGIKVTVHGSIASRRPLMIASNHISWTDIMVLGSVADVCFISKHELAGWPIFGSLARLQRTVFVERDKKRKSGEQAGELARRLAAGDAMVLFAEGSTSDGNLILPFKSTLFGAAEMAIRAGASDKVFVQPAAITYLRVHGMPMGRQHRTLAAWIGDAELVPHLGTLLMEGAIDVDVHFGEPIEFTAASDRKLVTREMEGNVRRMVATALRDARRPLVAR